MKGHLSPSLPDSAWRCSFARAPPSRGIDSGFDGLSQLVVHEDLYLDNVFNILQFEATRNQLKLRQPVNKEK